MAAKNEQALAKYAGVVYVGEYSSSIPTLLTDMTNANTVASYIDSNVVFGEMASVIDTQVAKNFNAELIEVETDDRGTIYKASRPEIRMTGTWYEEGDLDTVEVITGFNRLDVATSSVSITGEVIAAGWVALWEVYIIANKSWDNSVVASVVVDDNGTPLVLDTDYTLNVDADGSVTGTVGNSYLTFILASSANQVDVDYDYTPSASAYIGTNIITQELPRLVVKIVSLDSVSGKTNTEYLIDAGFEWELISAYIDPARAGDLTGSGFDFKWNKNGSYIKKAERGI